MQEINTGHWEAILSAASPYFKELFNLDYLH